MFYRRHERYQTPVGERSRTKQSHKDECDIYRILGQYQRTGIINHVQAARPTYEDLPSEVDYQASLNTLLAADEAFAALPASVRHHFDNDPSLFLAAFNDPAQEDKLREFGFLKPKEAAAPLAATTLPGTAPGGA